MVLLVPSASAMIKFQLLGVYSEFASVIDFKYNVMKTQAMYISGDLKGIPLPNIYLNDLLIG